jgi:hypothetical protein
VRSAVGASQTLDVQTDCDLTDAIANTDDPDMPASTIRAWVIGLLWAILIPGAFNALSTTLAVS